MSSSLYFYKVIKYNKNCPLNKRYSKTEESRQLKHQCLTLEKSMANSEQVERLKHAALQLRSPITEGGAFEPAAALRVQVLKNHSITYMGGCQN